MAKVILKSSAQDFGFDHFQQGAGLVNAPAATELALEYFNNADAGPNSWMMLYSDSHYDNLGYYTAQYFQNAWNNMGIDFPAYPGAIYDGTPVTHYDMSMYYGIFEDGDSAQTERLWFDYNSTAPDTRVYEYKAIETVSTNLFVNYTVHTQNAFNTSLENYTLPAPFVGYSFEASQNPVGANHWRLHIDMEELFGGVDFNNWASVFSEPGTPNGTIGLYISSDANSFVWNAFIHDWVDGNGDDLFHMSNGTVAGEIARVDAIFAGGVGAASMFWSPYLTWTGTPLMRMYEYALYADWGVDVNFSLELVRYDLVEAPWATVTDGNGYADVEVDPAAAPYGYIEGVVVVDDGESAPRVPLSFGKAVDLEHVQDGTVAPLDFATDVPYDYEKMSSEGYVGLGRTLPFTVSNSSAGAIQLNITEVGTPGAEYLAMTVEVGDSSSASSASIDTPGGGNVYVSLDIVPGAEVYWLTWRCWDAIYAGANGTARTDAEISMSFALAGPGFEAHLNGMAYPADGDTIGLVSPYASADANVTWVGTSAEFPDVTVTSSSLGFGIPPLDEDYPYEYTTDDSDQYVGPWNWLSGTQISITCTWTVNAGADMMDFGLYGPANPFGTHASGYGNDEITGWAMATGGGSPEVYSGTAADSGEYWIRIINFAGGAQSGEVQVYALTPGSTQSGAGATQIFDTSTLAEGTWQMTAAATDSLGGSHQALALVDILNTPAQVAPGVVINTALSGVVSGTTSISIAVTDDNNQNSPTSDDQFVWLHLYYTADEAGRYRIPIATFINATDASADDTNVTFSWDTTGALNTYVARLWVVADDGEALTVVSSGVFEIANAAGAGAEAPSIASSAASVIPMVALLLAALGIGALPVARKFWRLRRV
jgi:hypothetical protein